MKREIRDIIENDVVIPDIVLQAKEEAFAKIPNAAAPSEEKAEVALVKKTGRKFKKKWIAVAMVAVLAVGTLSAGAAVGGFDGALLRFMGINSEEGTSLPFGHENAVASVTEEVVDYSENEKGKKKDVTLSVSEVIGDNSSVYIRIDTDYELPEDFNSDTHVLTPWLARIEFYNDAELTDEVYPMDVHGIWNYEDGKLSFLYNISGLEDITSKYIHLNWENLFVLERENPAEQEIICEGIWDIVFQLGYEAQDSIVLTPDVAITVEDAEFTSIDNPDEDRSIKDIEVQISEIVIAPMTIQVRGIVPFEPTEEDICFMLYSLDKLTLKDGTVLEYDYSDFKGGDYKYNAGLQSYPGETTVFGENQITEMFGQGISLDELESITINGVDIKVK